MIQGAKGHAFHACMKEHGLLPRKIPKSSNFSQKNERIWGILGLREHEMRSNPCIIGQKGQKTMRFMLAWHHGLLPRKIPKSSHFSQKNERIWGISGLREHEMRSNPCIIGQKGQKVMRIMRSFHIEKIALLWYTDDTRVKKSCVSYLHEKAWLIGPQNTEK